MNQTVLADQRSRPRPETRSPLPVPQPRAAAPLEGPGLDWEGAFSGAQRGVPPAASSPDARRSSTLTRPAAYSGFGGAAGGFGGGSTEHVPLWRHRSSVVFLQWEHAEAAVRFGQVFGACEISPRAADVWQSLGLSSPCLPMTKACPLNRQAHALSFHFERPVLNSSCS